MGWQVYWWGMSKEQTWSESPIHDQVEAAGSALPAVNDFDGLYDYARSHGLHAVGAVLRKYVTGGEPLDWMPGYTSRSMCRCASMGVEGTAKDDVPPTYTMTKYGHSLYCHMWGGDELPQEPNQ